MCGGIGVEELEAVLVEAEDVEFVVVEIGEQLLLYAHEAALVQMVPYGLQHRSEAHVGKVVLHHRSQVFVEREECHGVELRLYSVHDDVALVLLEAVLIESIFLFLVELVDGDEQDRGVDEEACLSVTTQQQFAFLESLS